ncbi:FkbM family methyltransferase [Amycolatopsis sp. cmx-11-32]|uniref:FkbM family methyltransferase n=1 Tax=Amycolatopsis sp. cmx-11-32 TaxID=2785796 RepID=UPI0039E241AC
MTRLGLREFPYLADHRVQGTLVLPGAVYLDLALSALEDAVPSIVDDVRFDRVFVVPAEGTKALNTTIGPPIDGWREFTATGDDGVRYASGRIRRGEVPAGEWEPPAPGEEFPGANPYAALRKAGNDYGPAFRGIDRYCSGEGAATAELRIPVPVGGHVLHPVVLDTAMQLLAAAAAGRAVVLAGWDRLVLHRSPGRMGTVRVRFRELGDELVGDMLLSDPDGRVAAEVFGARLRFLESSPLRIAVAATFTAEPIEETLSFWAGQLGIPVSVEFAGYQQVFQELLDTGGLLSGNRDGENVLLIRPQDWLSPIAPLVSEADSATRDSILAGSRRHRLPGIGDIAHLVPYETDYLYEEIFTRRSYLRHGIELRDGDTVFDVGANIGLFSLFVRSRCPGAEVYAFEPNPPAFEALRRNTALYAPETRIFDYGLAAVDGELPFTSYSRSPAFSGFAADAERDHAAVTAVVANVLRNESTELVDHLTRDRLAAEVLPRRVRTLSAMFAEQGVERVDLLKIDAEGSEEDILAGIGDEQWPRIRQLVLEAHDPDGAERIASLLRDKGFQVVVDRDDELLLGTGFAGVFARRPGANRTVDLDRVAGEFIDAVRGADLPCLIALCPPSADARRDPVLKRAEQQLTEGLAGIPGVELITTAELARAYPVADPDDPDAERLGHIPYRPAYFAALGTMIARKLSTHRPVKALALDCDQTLWEGYCGEDGPDGVQPRAAVQEFALARHRDGVLLCLCSRNNDEDVRAVFDRRTDLPVRDEHIIARRVGWQPKSTGLTGLADELGFGTDTFVFLDDSPVECAEVRANLPEVLTLQLPAQVEEIPGFLDHVWAFDRARPTDEDRERPARYLAERRRRTARERALTFESFLDGLELVVRIGTYADRDLPRIAQLTQRTNQFTTSAVRRTEAELRDLFGSGGLDCHTVRVSDRFGDYGLVGVVLSVADGETLRVDTFLLSCRALGRGVEHRMLAVLGESASHRGLTRIELSFTATGRNEPARRFLEEVAGESFTMAAETASRVEFRPSTPPPPVPRTPRTPRTVSSGLPSTWYQRVATELRTPEDILAAVRRANLRSRPALPNAFRGPDDDVERELAVLWRKVLGLREVGVDDNFFDLGGSSLLGVRLMTGLDELAGTTLPPTSLFERPTIRAMAALLRPGEQAAEPVGTSGRRRGARRREIAQRARRRHGPG